MNLHLPGAAIQAVVAHLRRLCATPTLGALLAIVAIAAALLPAHQASAQGTIPSLPTAPDWLEPRGLNIVDMVGLVPDDQLRDAILVYETGTGLVQYQSGSRTGNTVIINANLTPRYGPGFTVVGCLGQPAAYDQWPTYAPASTMQIFSNGRDVTSSIILFKYTPSGLVLPGADASGYLRYERTATLPLTSASPVSVPANGGCQILISGQNLVNLTARFTLSVRKEASVTYLGGQRFDAHSYIGEGGTGKLGPLVDQMTRAYGTRHDSFLLEPPAGADYMFVKYGPTSFDPYAAESSYNYGLAGSGTYRSELTNGGLAVDMVSSMGIPIAGNWRDADQMGSSAYLSYSPLKGRMKTPEYFLPPGVPFNECMTKGGCPSDVLKEVYEATFPVQVYFYKVERAPEAQLIRVPLKMVGRGWAAASVSAAELAQAPFAYGAPASTSGVPQPEGAQQLPGTTFLPLVSKSNPPSPPLPPLPPDDPTGCPCGWFDAQGRMFDFIPPQ